MKLLKADRTNVVSLYAKARFFCYDIKIKYHKDTGKHTVTLNGLEYTHENILNVIDVLENYLNDLKNELHGNPNVTHEDDVA